MTYYNFILIREYTESSTPQKDWKVEAFSNAEKTQLLYKGEMTTCGEHLNNPAAVQAEVDGQILGPLTLDYVAKRTNAYPSIEDQLDKIFHEGIDAWKADMQAIKNKYPKP